MFTESMMESIKKVEATRAERMTTEPRRMTAEEKSELLKAYHPDYRAEGFKEIKIGPNKGQKAPVELTNLIHSNSRLLNENIDLTKIDYDVDVLVIGGGGAGCSAAIEAHEAGANVMENSSSAATKQICQPCSANSGSQPTAPKLMILNTWPLCTEMSGIRKTFSSVSTASV